MVDIRDRLVSHWNSGDAFRRQIVRRFLTRRGVDFHQVHAVVYCKHLDKISKLEGLIANLGRRRDTVYREIGRRREAVARRVRDMLNSEFDLETGEPVCWHPTNR